MLPTLSTRLLSHPLRLMTALVTAGALIAAAHAQSPSPAEARNVAVIGASGNVGSRIVGELVQRGYTVTAIARDPSRIDTAPGVNAVAGDTAQPDALANVLRGHAAVISATPFRSTSPADLIQAVRGSGVKRYLVVGGAGSLLGTDGTRLLDAADFPAAYLPEARGGAAFLDTLREVEDLDWTFLSPAAEFTAGERIGRYRSALDTPVIDPATGRSHISYADYAIALVDELERGAHIRQRFTVGD